jgi:hypothetical protein
LFTCGLIGIRLLDTMRNGVGRHFNVTSERYGVRNLISTTEGPR